MAPLHLAIGKDLEGSWPRLAWPTVEMVSSVENPAKSTNGCHGVIILPIREIQQKQIPWNWCKKHIIETCNWIYKSHPWFWKIFSRYLEVCLRVFIHDTLQTNRSISGYGSKWCGSPSQKNTTLHQGSSHYQPQQGMEATGFWSTKGWNPEFSLWDLACNKVSL